MSIKTDELREQLVKTLTPVRDIASKAETEKRDYTDEEREAIKKGLAEAESIKDQLKAAEADNDLRKAIDSLGDAVDLLPKSDPSDPDQNGQKGKPGKGQSIGEQFVSSPEFKDWMSQMAPNGVFSDGKKGINSPPVQFSGLKALITGVSDTSGGALTAADFLGLVDPGLRRPLTVRDIITQGTTGSDSVEYVRQDAQTNAAAPTAEATDQTTGTKPESTFTLVKITAPVRTIAHWLAATKRALSDAAQLRTLIDEFLRYGLEEEIEDQVINGSGAGENFSGILTTTGVQTHALGADDRIVAARKARTKVKVTGKAVPTAYVFHPNDWEQIDLMVDNEARYFFGGPMQLGTPRLWGLPVVESEACPEGTGLVGDFRKAVLWDREQASIQVSDSHSDFFIKNLVALLAEARAAFGIFRPAAFVKITGI
jgi:HK97 family phage major capsid protein